MFWKLWKDPLEGDGVVSLLRGQHHFCHRASTLRWVVSGWYNGAQDCNEGEPRAVGCCIALCLCVCCVLVCSQMESVTLNPRLQWH